MPRPLASLPPNQKPPFNPWRQVTALWRWLCPAKLADQDRQSRLSRLTGAALIVTACVSLSVMAIRFARPIYNTAQHWHASHLVAEARRLADEGDVFNAVLKAQDAYSMSPENIDAVRLNAEFFTRMKRPEALYFWDKLAGLDSLSAADEQMRVRALLHADREKEAREQLEILITKHTADEGVLQLAQEVLGGSLFDEALLRKLKEYLASHPDDLPGRLRLARLQLMSGSAQETAEALDSLWQLAAGSDQSSVEALMLLDDYAGLPAEHAPRLIQRLLDHPRADAAMEVRAARRQAKLAPSQRAALAAQLIDKYQDAGRNDLLHLTLWLSEEKAFPQILSLLARREDVVLAHQPLLENYLSALTALNRMEDLQRLLDDPRVNHLLSRSTTAYYRLHMAFLTRQPLEELRARMKTAIQHAEHEGRVENLVSIGQYGEQHAMPDLAAEAYRAAMRSRRTYAAALEKLLRATLASGSSAEHLDALREAASQWPDNQDYQERLAYMRLLTGMEIETAVWQADRLLAIRPRDPVTRLLVAMGAWRLSHQEDLRRQLPDIDTTRLSHGQRIVLAAMARAAGNTGEALRHTSSIPANAVLFPEERQLFAVARSGLP